MHYLFNKSHKQKVIYKTNKSALKSFESLKKQAMRKFFGQLAPFVSKSLRY